MTKCTLCNQEEATLQDGQPIKVGKETHTIQYCQKCAKIGKAYGFLETTDLKKI